MTFALGSTSCSCSTVLPVWVASPEQQQCLSGILAAECEHDETGSWMPFGIELPWSAVKPLARPKAWLSGRM